MTITTAIATRQGTGANLADAAVVFASERGDVGAGLVDIAGHDPRAPFTARLLAETAARIAPQRGTLAALLTAGLLVADAGAQDEPEPDGVGVAAWARLDGLTRIAWIGDSHAYAWDGAALTRLTTPHTWGEQLRTRFDVDVETSKLADHILTTSLSNATPATVLHIDTRAPLVILATDGLDDVYPEELASMVANHGSDPQALADVLVAAPGEDETGYRDDVTVVVVQHHD
ncbi:hypothetical protein [Streptomyces sp. NPDC020983]|uniref:hypothetical protein n=1 Tax=Streptomyces sp. NPDC020983 TaxID=3365106 RepID=UPI0037B527BF